MVSIQWDISPTASVADCRCRWSAPFMHELVLFVAIPFVGVLHNLVVASFALH